MKTRFAGSVLALIAGAGLVAAACASFRDEPAEATDASTDAASASDVSEPTNDGAVDATPSFDAAVVDADPCTQPDAFFCDDFERPAANLLGAEWSLVNPGYGPATIGIFTLDAGDLPPSGTRVLRARHRIPDAGTSGGADSSRYVFFTYQGNPTALDVSFAMNILAVPKPHTQVMEIAFAPTVDAGESAVVISVDADSQLHLFEELTAGSQNNPHVDDQIVLDTWRHYRLRVDTATKKARLTIEGRTQDLVLTLQREHGAPRAVRFGVVYEPPQTANTDTWIDDVIIQR